MIELHDTSDEIDELDALADLLSDGGWHPEHRCLAGGDPHRLVLCERGGYTTELVRCAGAWRDGEDRCMRPTTCPVGPDRSWAMACIQARITHHYHPPAETRPAVLALLARPEEGP